MAHALGEGRQPRSLCVWSAFSAAHLLHNNNNNNSNRLPANLRTTFHPGFSCNILCLRGDRRLFAANKESLLPTLVKVLPSRCSVSVSARFRSADTRSRSAAEGYSFWL